MSESRKTRYLNIGLMILLVVAVGAAAYLWFPRSATTESVPETVAQAEAAVDSKISVTESTTETDPPSPVSLAETMLADARHFEGDPNAPVTIIEFSDFK